MSHSSAAVAAAALQDHFCRRFKLSPARPARADELTLAQRLRLVDAPVRLSPADWLKVHAAALQRGGDAEACCAVCLAPLAAQPTVLLSCSHELHASCQAAVERFAGQRACPCCRCSTYDKSSVLDLDASLAAGPRPAQPVLRRRWCEARLSSETDKLVRQVEASSCELDALFAELDASIAAAGAVGSHLLPGSGGGGSVGSPEAAAAAAGPGSAPPAQQELDWKAVIDRCLTRDEAPECAICLARLAPPPAPRKAGGSSKSSGGGRIAVLSCSHAFHGCCLNTVEAFALASSLPASCPCCRTQGYARVDLG